MYRGYKKDQNELKEMLLKVIKKIDGKGIQLDLEVLVEDRNFVKNISKNLKGILERKIGEL